jgi:hypothetical protein
MHIKTIAFIRTTQNKLLFSIFTKKQVWKQDLVLQLDVIIHLFGYLNKGMWNNN